MKIRLHRRRAFTLIEIMVAAALLSVMLSATFGALIATNNNSQRIFRIANTQEVARQALDLLAADLRSAGLGIASGEVGVAPAATSEYRVPVIYSGPDTVVQQPYQRSSLISNSIYIISAEPTTLGLPADGTGTQGVVLDAGTGASIPLQVSCAASDGGPVRCDNNTSGIYSGTSALLVGDLRNAVVVSPLSIANGSTSSTQLIQYREAAIASFTTDPKIPYGISSGALLSRLRVVHWYLRQDDPNAPPRLYRSRPLLATSNAVAFSCASGSSLFLDETTGGSAVGQEMGAGPVESLQIRYVIDPNNTGQFNSFQMVNTINPCDAASLNYNNDPYSNQVSNNIVPQVVSKLREVRIQVVAISPSPDLNSSASRTLQIGYTTPGFEGAVITPDGGTVVGTDPYPRRAFNVRVVPRALQQQRL